MIIEKVTQQPYQEPEESTPGVALTPSLGLLPNYKLCHGLELNTACIMAYSLLSIRTI